MNSYIELYLNITYLKTIIKRSFPKSDLNLLDYIYISDADAVPEGITGRWTFTVLSICSMLVHAYYTSAIVSALMSTGRGGPKTVRALADSRYAIASEDHDFIRQTMFSVSDTD